MKKILILLFLAFILSGCVTYKFQKPNASGEGSQGYLTSYGDKPILEYTVGKEKSLPDLGLAKERFKRRKDKVEYYYKKMGEIESRVKEVFWEPPAMIMDFIGGILRWPIVAVTDYKYNRNLKYKARVDKLDEEKEALEKARINSLREKLAAYIAEDLSKEPASESVAVAAPVASKPALEALPPVSEPLAEAPALPVTQEIVPKAEIPAASEIIPPVAVAQPVTVAPVKPVKKIKPPVVKAPPVEKILVPPLAVITAKPVKGYSPLLVKFSGQKSSSKNAKIIAYNWDFGDGDISTKKNPENIYYSTTYGARNFTATLTIKDAAGATASTTLTIEVSTP